LPLKRIVDIGEIEDDEKKNKIPKKECPLSVCYELLFTPAMVRDEEEAIN
jgi:hypothetical protein